MRFRSLFATAAASATLACSGSGFDPAPSTDVRGNGSTKGSDTTITTGPQSPPQLPPVVSSFALSGTVFGVEPGADTTRQAPLPNVSVTVVKIMTVQGDTLRPSVTVATTTTDAQGAYRLENLTPAYYRIDFGAPAGSPYIDSARGIGPARETEIQVNVALARKP